MVKITFEAATILEVIEQFKTFVGTTAPPHLKEQLEFDLDANQDSTIAKPKKKKRKTSKTKTKSASGSPKINPIETTPPDVDAVTSAASNTSITVDEVREALQNLNGSKGFEAAKEILNKFSCNRVGEIPEDKYEEFVKACKEY